MRDISDPHRIRSLISRHGIADLFTIDGLEFRLYSFERGEILNYAIDLSEHILFLVSGSLMIIGAHDDGKSHPLSIITDFTCLGDMEFCGKGSGYFLSEVKSRCEVLALPLWNCRERLLNDNAFLRYILGSISEKLYLISRIEINFNDLREKLLYFMANECPDRTFKGMELTAGRLHCSRRQLQRLLRSLCAEGLVLHSGRGCYTLL